MKKYFTDTVILVSIICGIIAYAIFSFIVQPIAALLIGAGVVAVISLAFPLAFSIGDMKYKPLKTGISAPLLVDERVNCVIGGVVRHGFMVLNKESIFIITFIGKKPIRYEIRKKEVKKVSVTGDIYINIFLDYNKFIQIVSGNSINITEKLNEEGFGS